MKRTSPGLLLVLALLSAGAGFGFDHLLTVTGRATFTPSGFLPVLLIIVAAASLGLAWPVRRSVRGGTRIDPFRALRAATLARASSLLGAIMAGFGVGLIAFLSSRPVPAPVGSTVALVALIVVSGTVTVYLYRQASLAGKDLSQGQQLATVLNQNEVAVQSFVTRLVAFGEKHPDFSAQVLKKYGIEPRAGIPANAMAPAPATVRRRARRRVIVESFQIASEAAVLPDATSRPPPLRPRPGARMHPRHLSQVPADPCANFLTRGLRPARAGETRGS